MGGHSSKSVKTNYEVRHTVEGESVSTNIRKKGSLKKKTKNSVKIKDKKGSKLSKSLKGRDPPGAQLSVIEEIADTGGDSSLPNCSVYRKKSSCTSCQARDILLGKNRSRSGSEKSLRFSDFNKVLRKTRIYDWEMAPLNIPLYGEGEPSRDDICYICEVYTGSHIRACRVCYRAYHDSCLTKIGHPLSDISRHLLANDKWSCHQCVSLNHLLTQEEVQRVLNELDDLDISKDHMTEASYLKYCKHCLGRDNRVVTSEQENNCVRRFQSVVQVKPGVISFSQFLNIETVRILGDRCKDSLVHLLTKAELAEARKIFQKHDSGKTGQAPRSAVMSHVQQSRSGAHQQDDNIRYIDEELDSMITWPEFLRDIAIYLISQRSNLGYVESPGSIRDDIEDGTLTFSSCDSLDVEEERYSTCNSELEPSVVLEDPAVSASQVRLSESNLTADDSLQQGENSSTMLDDITAHIDRNHRNDDLCVAQAELAVSTRQTQELLQAGPRTDLQMSAELNIQHPATHLSHRSLKPRQAANIQTGNEWADKDLKTAAERARCSHYNDSNHILIPWEDVENRSCPKGDNNDNTKPAYRRSEVIPRHAVTTSCQSRAVSQAGCPYVQTATCGDLQDRFSNEDWKC